ncbi:ABC1 kinase family protein [Spirochaeta africana]|uniref:Putative unusual protein kinase n=1 Tax=Spirochaeta africana (strain ATCC 700263 / DSM 8902 / Z-7692) TaxID=889378 RepID=H9UI11_SPIAZ|nr:AarF/UbiB family protein [Spirochaeta africana]AFG37154.1 putative unusual protein kinase [Spirochaeta africana DSM 8902]
MSRKHAGILRQTFTHTRRFQEMVTILIRFGFTDYLTMMRLDRRFRFIRRLIARDGHSPPENTPREQLIRMALEELGPTFIKLGQLLSNRPDIIPPALLRELTRLQDSVPPVPFHQIADTISREFGRPCREVFAHLEAEPLASASIAQVHQARLPSGMQVAVKVQRPDIWDTMSIDLDILSALAHLVERYMPESRYFQPVELVREFSLRLQEEIDFRHECHNITRFHDMFPDTSRVRIPQVFTDYSTRRVLTMEYMPGHKLNAVLRGEAPRVDREAAARSITRLMLEQIFLHGFFHADPHPGNIMVGQDGRIGFLDFGLVGELRPRDTRYLTSVLVGTVHKDAAQLSEALLRITGAADRVLRENIEDDVYDIVERYVDLEMNEIQTDQLFNELIMVIINQGLTVPSSLLLFTKTLLLLDGLIRSLAPNLNPIQLFEPFVREYLVKRIGFDYLKRETLASGRDLAELARRWPRDTRELIELVKHGRLRMHFHVEGLEPVRATLDLVSYRLVFGLLLASVIISSAVVIHAGIPPLWHGIPVFGIFGFLGAGFVSIGYIGVLMVKFLRRLYRK